MNDEQPVYLPQTTRSVILKASLSGTATKTPYVESYSLVITGAANPLIAPGLRFTGKELDTGTGLEYFGARYYDPEVGRFTSIDPMGDGVNWYEYCYSNPLRYTDPNGKFGCEAILGFFGISLPSVGEIAAAFGISVGAVPALVSALPAAIIWLAVQGLEEDPAKSKSKAAGGAAASGNHGDDEDPKKNGKNKESDSNDIKNTYKSIKDSPNYPKGFRGIQDGTQKFNVTNKGLLAKLREIEPGKWVKVYKDGYDALGNKISIHCFQSESGQVFDVSIKSGWSNYFLGW